MNPNAEPAWEKRERDGAGMTPGSSHLGTTEPFQLLRSVDTARWVLELCSCR